MHLHYLPTCQYAPKGMFLTPPAMVVSRLVLMVISPAVKLKLLIADVPLRYKVLLTVLSARKPVMLR